MITAPTVVKRRAIAQWTWLRSKLKRTPKPAPVETTPEPEIHGEVVTMRTAAE